MLWTGNIEKHPWVAFEGDSSVKENTAWSNLIPKSCYPNAIYLNIQYKGLMPLVKTSDPRDPDWDQCASWGTSKPQSGVPRASFGDSVGGSLHLGFAEICHPEKGAGGSLGTEDTDLVNKRWAGCSWQPRRYCLSDSSVLQRIFRHNQCNQKDKMNGFGNFEEIWINRITAHS